MVSRGAEGPAGGTAPELGAGTRGARADDPSPALDPWVTGDSGETPPDAHAEMARRLVSGEADAMTGLESKASRARARRQWRTAAAAFRQWRQRGRVAACARRALATVGKHRAFDRTTAVAAIASWRCLATRERRAANDAAAARVATSADAVSMRERAVDATVEKMVAAKMRDAARAVEAARVAEEEAKRRALLRVRAAELERDAHCEDAERERARAAAAEAEGVAAARRVAEGLAEEARRAAHVAAADAAAEREWLRVALEKAWAEVLAYRRRAGARDADASLHEHLASVAGEAWADELAKALVPPAAGTARAMLGDGCASAATRRDAKDTEETRKTQKSALLAKTNAAANEKQKPAKRGSRLVSRAPGAGVARGLNPPASIGRVVGVARRDFVSVPSAREEETRASAAARLTPAWRAPSAADPSPLAAEERRDREAARERARARREGRFGDRGHSTRAASSPWTPKSLRVSSRAASLLGLDPRTRDVSPVSLTGLGDARTDEGARFRLSLPCGDSAETGDEKVHRRTYAGAASPTRATLATRERRSDAAWETSRARFALSREAFREAVAQRQKKNDETETETNSAASYSVQTPGGTTSETTRKKKMSRLGVSGAEGGALALAAAAARRFALPGDTDSDSDGASSASDEHEWLFREEKLST